MRPIWHTANWATKIAASIAASILIVSTDKQSAAMPISGSRPIFTIQPTPKCARVPPPVHGTSDYETPTFRIVEDRLGPTI